MTLRGSARRSIPYLVAIMSGFLFAYLIVAFFIFPAHLVTTDTKVPNVVGQTYEAAAAQLQKLGFAAARGEQRFTAGAASGQVLGQNPLPDAVLPAGTKVVLDVSQGQRTTQVPQIVGMTRQQAELALQNAGLDAGEYYESDLIGCEVVERDGEASLGRVKRFQDGGTSGLFEMESGLLIPFVRAVCVAIEPERRRIVVDLPAGLKELYQA